MEQIEEKGVIESFFQERENFINNLAPKELNGWRCNIHKVLVGKGKKCPLCEQEERHHIKISLEGNEEEKTKLRERKRREMLDPEKRAKHYELVKRYNENNKIRKIEHIGIEV